MTEKKLSFIKRLSPSRLFNRHSKRSELSQSEVSLKSSDDFKDVRVVDVRVADLTDHEVETQPEDQLKVNSESSDDFGDAEIVDVYNHEVKEAELKIKEAELKKLFEQIIPGKDYGVIAGKLAQCFNIESNQDCTNVTVINLPEMRNIVNSMPEKDRKKVKKILNRLKYTSGLKIKDGDKKKEVKVTGFEVELELEKRLKLFPKKNRESLAVELAQCFKLLRNSSGNYNTVLTNVERLKVILNGYNEYHDRKKILSVVVEAQEQIKLLGVELLDRQVLGNNIELNKIIDQYNENHKEERIEIASPTFGIIAPKFMKILNPLDELFVNKLCVMGRRENLKDLFISVQQFKETFNSLGNEQKGIVIQQTEQQKRVIGEVVTTMSSHLKLINSFAELLKKYNNDEKRISDLIGGIEKIESIENIRQVHYTMLRSKNCLEMLLFMNEYSDKSLLINEKREDKEEAINLAVKQLETVIKTIEDLYKEEIERPVETASFCFEDLFEKVRAEELQKGEMSETKATATAEVKKLGSESQTSELKKGFNNFTSLVSEKLTDGEEAIVVKTKVEKQTEELDALGRALTDTAWNAESQSKAEIFCC